MTMKKINAFEQGEAILKILLLLPTASRTR